jgi:hypothetical protein
MEVARMISSRTIYRTVLAIEFSRNCRMENIYYSKNYRAATKKEMGR